MTSRTRSVVAAAVLFVVAVAPSAGAAPAGLSYRMFLPLAGDGRDTVGAHDATVDPAYPGVEFSPWSAGFNDAGRLDVAASPDLSPGARDFGVGISFSTRDFHVNLYQAGNSRGADPRWKIDLAGNKTTADSHGVLRVKWAARCRITGALGTVLLVGDRNLNDGANHTVTCTRVGRHTTLVVDGREVARRGLDVGSVNVADRRIVIGGKDGNPSAIDCFAGRAWNAWIGVGS